MATIDLTNDLILKLLERCKKEYGETVVSNFALDIIVNELSIENEALKEQMEALKTRIKSQDNTIAELQELIRPDSKFNKKKYD